MTISSIVIIAICVICGIGLGVFHIILNEICRIIEEVTRHEQ